MQSLEEMMVVEKKVILCQLIQGGPLGLPTKKRKVLCRVSVGSYRRVQYGVAGRIIELRVIRKTKMHETCV